MDTGFIVGANSILTCISLLVSDESFRKCHETLSRAIVSFFGFLFHALRGAHGTESVAGRILHIVLNVTNRDDCL